jgi:hypothetical protein
MALVQSGVHAGSVVAAVAQEDLDRVCELVKQRSDLGGVIDVAVGQDGGHDPAGHHVKADVQRSAACWCRVSRPATPPSFRPELSTSRWTGPPVEWGCVGSSRL